MKRILIFIILFMTTFGARLFSSDSNVTKIGGWGTGAYNDVFTKGKYAYIAADWNGLDIVDIAIPSKPLAVGNLNLKAQANAVFVYGNYAYVACSDGLHIVNVSTPASPKAAGIYYLQNGTIVDVIVDGNYAYLASTYSRYSYCSIDILDVSNPAEPGLIGNSIYIGDCLSGSESLTLRKNGHYLFYANVSDQNMLIYDVSDPFSPQYKNTINPVEKFAVNGNFAYTIYKNNLKIFNIANPAAPQEMGTYAIGYDTAHIFSVGNYLYLAEQTDQYQWQLQIIDVSNPTIPKVSGSCQFSAAPSELVVTGGTALMAAKRHGLYTFDVSKPAAPRLLKKYDFSWQPIDVFVTANRAYVADAYGELKIFDITAPASPVLLGTYTTLNNISALSVPGNYIYLATAKNGLEIVDATDPARPVKAGSFCTDCNFRDVAVKGNYAYLLRNQDNIFYILDLANPISPIILGQLQINPMTKIHIEGNYALLSGEYGVDVVDITNPAAPVMISDFYGGRYTNVGGVHTQAPYAYVGNNSTTLHSLDIFHFSPPATPVRAGQYFMKDDIYDLYAKGNYAYLAASSGLYVMDAANPGFPTVAGHLDANIQQGAVTVQGKYIYLVTGSGGRFEILEFKPGNRPAQLRVNRFYLRFHADQAKNISAPQTFSIDTPGDNNLAWSLETLSWTRVSKIDWLKLSQDTGTGSAEISVSIDPAKVEKMLENKYQNYELGYISISAPNAMNPELEIWASIEIDANTESYLPFGELSTPPANTVVSGSVPITGWALDNIGVAGVQIYREENNQLVFVGDAVFVEGARPDVEIRYPDYPNYFKAGWGYMLLTQSLPRGDGPLTLHAVANDIEGNRATLGTTTITVSNANSTKPFGAIDTPGQGETISGRGYINFGWALTPRPNTIPVDGSTIHVWIDGIMSGQPVYNQYRQDLAELFPGLNNSEGAAGYFNIDTTKYANGVHTIAWSVTDDAGNSEGIGSRYFKIGNETTVNSQAITNCSFNPRDLEKIEIEKQPVRFKTGFHPAQDMETAPLSEDGISKITIHQLERVEIDLGITGGNISGYLLVGNTQRPLPIGSTLDPGNGIFYWQPGPGFVGTYSFIFVKEDKDDQAVMVKVKRLIVNIPFK